jgi:DNA-binding response OmpR family regulator
MHLLIVDDDNDCAETLKAFLLLSGHEVRVARDVSTALGLIDQSVPEATIIDIGLPETDGYELARRLRSRPDLSRMALIAYSGWSRARDQAAGIEAGFDHYVTKPADPVVFNGILSQLARTR